MRSRCTSFFGQVQFLAGVFETVVWTQDAVNRMKKMAPDLAPLHGPSLRQCDKIIDVYANIAEEAGVGIRKESGTMFGNGGAEVFIGEAGVCVVGNIER